MAFHVPAQLAALLGQNAALAGAVSLTLEQFHPWIADNECVFFPEYTDHGSEHVDAVLRAAESLIRDEAWSRLTAEGAAVIELAALLHDCAMHIHEEGLSTAPSCPART